MRKFKKAKERKLERSYQVKKLFNIIVATFVRWCDLIPQPFHFFNQKKKKDQIY